MEDIGHAADRRRADGVTAAGPLVDHRGRPVGGVLQPVADVHDGEDLGLGRLGAEVQRVVVL